MSRPFIALAFGKFPSANHNSYELVVTDLGYARKARSCGIAWVDAENLHSSQHQFGEVVNTVAAQLIAVHVAGRRPLLVIEAPLSTYHRNGCPDCRGEFESETTNAKGIRQPRGWYHGTGASVTLGAIRFLSEIAKRLTEAAEVQVTVAEAFLSQKTADAGHAADALQILKEFWSTAPTKTKEGLEPLDLIDGVPCVRVFRTLA